MFLDKYKITKFDDFCLNKSILTKLNNYFNDNNIFNSIIYGPNDIGKYTIIMCILYKVFGESVYNKKNINMKISNGLSNKEVSIISSSYHYEIALNNYSFNDKGSLSCVLSNIAKNININSMSYNVIVIKNAQYLTTENISVIKNICEKYNNHIRVLMTSNNISYIYKKLTNFFYIRVPVDNYDNYFNYFKNISINENINISDDKIKEIIMLKKRSIKTILLHLEQYHLSNKNNLVIKNNIDEILNNLINIIIGKNKFDIDKLRNIIYSITTKNIDKIIVYHYIYDRLTDFKFDFNTHQKILNLITEYQHRSKTSYKDIIHLEALIINLIYLLN